MPALRIPLQRVLLGLALARLASPLGAMDCREWNRSCPKNNDKCRWESCLENGVEVYFYNKWCDGWVQEIRNGMADVRQEEPCEEGSGDDQPGEKHPLYHLSSPW